MNRLKLYRNCKWLYFGSPSQEVTHVCVIANSAEL
jgi:hypothetical protein